jgi:3-(methylsulfanyl)propanoyl-CoA dehydrogenase
MTEYRAPVNETSFILLDVLGIGAYARLDGFSDLSPDVISDIFSQIALFSEKTLHPLNEAGDRHGCTWHADGSVTTPPGFPGAYRELVAAGWPGAAGPAEFGGGGLPRVIGFAYLEYIWAANPGFAMHASHLGHAAVLRAHGTAQQRAMYAPHLVAGDWAGAMALTEPQAGTDLGLISTRAVDHGDGTYRITGTKIFISGGEHDMAENIIHFVLARIDGAPTGTKGLSLFLVPKLLPDDDGRPAQRNGVSCGGIEQKMGIHASPTCTMNYDEAIGFLVGEPHRGLPAMFVLMNHMRLITATQGLGISEIAYQNAVSYARQRRQGRAPAGPRDPGAAADPILAMPDVRRLLWQIRSFNEAARALLLFTALQLDLSERAVPLEERQAAADLASLLAPVVKGTITEQAYDNTVDAQRVFGGSGYIRDTGVEQFIRDVRVAAIGEGVTAVQAMDLLRRKLTLNGGATMTRLTEQIAASLDEGDAAGREVFTRPLRRALADLTETTAWITHAVRTDPDAAAAAAVDYLRLFGSVALGWMWLRIVGAVLARPADTRTGTAGAGTDAAAAARLALARFYLDRLPGETAMRHDRMKTGTGVLAALSDAQF